MIWLTWRHYRWLVVLGILALVILIPLFVLNVNSLNAAYQQPDFDAFCFKETGPLCRLIVFPGLTTQSWYNFVFQTFPLLPFVAGIFIGAPLLAREYERRTHLFAWTQGVSSTHWLSVNLLLVGGAVALGFGALSLVTTWWSFIQDALVAAPWATFMIRGSAFVANALFCLMFGVMVGAVMRRVLPAMVITLLLLIPLQLAIWNGFAHLYPPPSQNWKVINGGILEFRTDQAQDLILTVSTEKMGAVGQETADTYVLNHPCPDDKLTGVSLVRCIEKNSHILGWYDYFGEHFWPLQLVTTALLLALAALCTGITYWQVRRLS